MDTPYSLALTSVRYFHFCSVTWLAHPVLWGTGRFLLGLRIGFYCVWGTFSEDIVIWLLKITKSYLFSCSNMNLFLIINKIGPSSPPPPAMCLFSLSFSFFGGEELCCLDCGISVPWPGVESRPSAVKVSHPNHWTAREISFWKFFKHTYWGSTCILMLLKFQKHKSTIRILKVLHL